MGRKNKMFGEKYLELKKGRGGLENVFGMRDIIEKCKKTALGYRKTMQYC